MKISPRDIAQAFPEGHVWLFSVTFTPEQRAFIYEEIAKALNKKATTESYERAFIEADVEDFPSC
jgi:hypothetical protein